MASENDDQEPSSNTPYQTLSDQTDSAATAATTTAAATDSVTSVSGQPQLTVTIQTIEPQLVNCAMSTSASSSSNLDELDQASADSLRAAAHAPFKLSTFIYAHIPILSWFPAYSLRAHLVGDLIAGITVGLMVIPQGLGYATVAGAPQVYGLYSALIGVVMYSIFGGCKDISVGPTAILSLLSYQANGGNIEVAIQMAMLSGVFQLLLAFCNLGVLVDFISNPVLSGFTSAAAIQIILTQIGKVCGYKTRTEVYYAVYDVFHDIKKLSYPDLLLGLASMAVLIFLTKIKSRYPNSFWIAQISIGRNALIVLITALLSYIIYHSNGSVPWSIVGHVPSGLPTPSVPSPSSSLLKTQGGNIALSAFVGFLESIAIAKSFARQNGYAHKLSSNQELFAIGCANFVGSFFGSLPVTGSFSRTAVASQAGAKTQLQGVITALVVLLALIFLTPAFYYIPNTVLSAVVIVAASNLVDVSICGDLWRLSYLGRLDLASLVISFLGCLFLDIQYGIAIAIAISLGITIYQMARPRQVVLEPLIGSNVVIPEYELSQTNKLHSLTNGDASVTVTKSTLRTTPDQMLILRIDSSMVFFNIGHLTSLITRIELERFALVPIKQDTPIPKDPPMASLNADLNQPLTPREVSIPTVEHLYDPDGEMTEREPHPALFNPPPGVQGIQPESPLPASNEFSQHDSPVVTYTESSREVAASVAALSSIAVDDESKIDTNGEAVHSFDEVSFSTVPALVKPFSAISNPNPRLRPCRMRILLLDCSSVNVIDTSAVRGLHEFCRELASRPKPVSVHFACVKPHIYELLHQALHHHTFPTGIQQHIHRSVETAIDAILYRKPVGPILEHQLLIPTASSTTPSLQLNGSSPTVDSSAAVRSSTRVRVRNPTE